MYLKVDYVVVWWVLFMKLFFLFRDIEDVYYYGDGDCIFKNVKFEMFCVDVVYYIKYCLWLWYM